MKTYNTPIMPEPTEVSDIYAIFNRAAHAIEFNTPPKAKPVAKKHTTPKRIRSARNISSFTSRLESKSPAPSDGPRRKKRTKITTPTTASTAKILTPELFYNQTHLHPNYTLHFHRVDHSVSHISFSRLYNVALTIRRSLIAQGVNPKDETRVGICLQRGPNLFASFFAIWMAGGTAVALEHTAEDDASIKYKLAKAKVNLVICQSSTIDRIPRHTATINLERLSATPYADYKPDFSQIHGNTAAYITFTSGSTGKPKGVLVEHAALYNLSKSLDKLRKERVVQGLHSASTLLTDGILINASPTFDAFLAEMLLAMFTPKSHLICAAHRRSPARIKQIITEFSPSIAIFSADMAVKLDPLELAKLSDITLMGSSPTEGLLKTIAFNNPHALVRNELGVSEACVRNTDHFEHKRKWNDERANSIGKAINGCEITLLTQRDQTLEVSPYGEMYYSGVCLARGYVNDPEKTRQRFIHLSHDSDKRRFYPQSHPSFSSLPLTTRFYKSGDLGRRLLPGGEIVFEGRVDREVKIQGYRVNQNAIEQYLTSYEGVKNAAVTTLGSGDFMQVGACIELEEKTELTKEEIYQHLNSTPLHSVAHPKVLLFHEIPLTTNGKADYKKITTLLINHKRSSPVSRTRTITTATGSIESELVTIWSELLAIPSECIDVKDDFEQLGGDSAMFAQLEIRINRNFDLKFPHCILINELKAHKTIHTQATLINTKISLTASASSSQRTTPVVRALSPAAYFSRRPPTPGFFAFPRSSKSTQETQAPIPTQFSGHFR